MSPTTHSPPTQRVMAMDCSASVMALTDTAKSGDGHLKYVRHYASQVFDVEDLVLLDASRCLDFGDITGIFPDQRACNGRTDGNLVAFDIRLIIADDLVSHGFAAVYLFEIHCR